MPYYRLYHLDPHTGHFNGVEDIFAADDVAAVHDLPRRQSDHPLELWQEGRKVFRLDALPEVAAPAPRGRHLGNLELAVPFRGTKGETNG